MSFWRSSANMTQVALFQNNCRKEGQSDVLSVRRKGLDNDKNSLENLRLSLRQSISLLTANAEILERISCLTLNKERIRQEQ